MHRSAQECSERSVTTTSKLCVCELGGESVNFLICYQLANHVTHHRKSEKSRVVISPRFELEHRYTTVLRFEPYLVMAAPYALLLSPQVIKVSDH